MSITTLTYEALERILFSMIAMQRHNTTLYGAYMVQWVYREMERRAYV